MSVLTHCDYSRCTKTKNESSITVFGETEWYEVHEEGTKVLNFCSTLHLCAHFIVEGITDQAMLAHILEGDRADN